ncbi:MAG: hypothetical protein E7000_09290 [Coriobacteriaceae bacterium]|nr:hypothetical protein [Coriobacteriaceae bacterium]
MNGLAIRDAMQFLAGKRPMTELLEEGVRGNGMACISQRVADGFRHAHVRRIRAFDDILHAQGIALRTGIGTMRMLRNFEIAALLAGSKPYARLVAAAGDIVVDDVCVALPFDSTSQSSGSTGFEAAILVHFNSSLA